ncbi:hypothetical protein ES332_A13G104600v1 [Gossypium tomentosum]|uniref:NADH dehydrogenase [ubiquinone] 1 beta subcomplex subunit 9 n=1 Tax=Gossypium tomentosum TaxID=34277 RepID=A0A5D2MJJ3_GOSTO|nr:hypothetical protein ES332_A13G104600v1 [Gossypium tomentosum]
MSGATTVAYLARRAAQKEKVRILYRCALKDILNWAVHRHLFYQDLQVKQLIISGGILILISIEIVYDCGREDND